MELVSFNDYEQNQRMYGGTAGRKIGITYQGRNYLLKFPGNLKEKQMKNIVLSYSNSLVREYIGSNTEAVFLADNGTEIRKSAASGISENSCKQIQKSEIEKGRCRQCTSMKKLH